MVTPSTTGERFNMQTRIKTIQQIKQQGKNNISDARYKAFAQEWQPREGIKSTMGIILCLYLSLLVIISITIFVLLQEGI